METGNFVLGPAVAEFEEAFAAYCGRDHCVGLASGADALHLSLRALGVGPGDEVITAANTFIATVNAIAQVGATPVLVDISPDDYNLDPALLEEALTDKTKAIIPVHLYGQPARMDAVAAFADAHGLKIVEDACQAHGALYRGQRAGSLSHAGCFSFYPAKNLGSFGEGGAVVTNDGDVAEQLRIYRNVGQSEKYVHPVPGFNSRLHSMQAAVLTVKLRHLDAWNEKRRAFAALYNEALTDVPGVEIPQTKPETEPVWHLYVIQHPRRDALMAFLKEREIFCGIHYPIPIADQEAYQGVRAHPADLPVTRAGAPRILSLPMHPDLTPEEVAYVADNVREFANQ